MINCEKCGACCKLIKCEHLNKNNECERYETRPNICRSEHMYETVYKKYMSKIQYKDIAKIACEQLRKKVRKC